MNECGVCLSSGCDFADNGFMKWNAAFKTPMTCCECGRKIPAGEIHEKARYREEAGSSKWFTNHTCAVCAEIAWAFFCDSRLYECLWDYMGDVYEELTTSCFDRLRTPAAKAELRQRWMEWKGLSA